LPPVRVFMTVSKRSSAWRRALEPWRSDLSWENLSLRVTVRESPSLLLVVTVTTDLPLPDLDIMLL
jgi:hypothetical protein